MTTTHGGQAPFVVLCLILALALGLRVEFAKNHIGKPTPDARGYARIAESLYTTGQFGKRGSFGAQEVQEPTNYSPGVPLFAAGIYYATGGVHPLLARLALAVLGTVAVYFTFLIGRRLVGGAEGRRTPRAAWAGVIATIPLAMYPALLEYHGMIMSEPLGIFFLSGAVLSFLWAGEQRGFWPWALPGLLFGLTALTRPEYLTFGAVFAILAVVRLARDGKPWRPRLTAAGAFLAAFLIPVIPWTIHNFVALDRLVPLSTGGAKALFIGTYLPGDGDNDKTREVLLERNPKLRAELLKENPATTVIFLDQVLDRLAARHHPGLPVDEALTRDGEYNFRHYWTARPAAYAWMFIRKPFRMWWVGPRATMTAWAWRAFHLLLVILAATGLVILAARRRWEAVVLGALTVGITIEGTLLLAEPRRVLMLLPVVCALAATGTVWLYDAATNREQAT